MKKGMGMKKGMSTFSGYRFAAAGEATDGDDEMQIESKIGGDASKRLNVETSRRWNVGTLGHRFRGWHWGRGFLMIYRAREAASGSMP